MIHKTAAFTHFLAFWTVVITARTAASQSQSTSPLESERHRHQQACVYPQPCWPSDGDWNSLNSTLGGSLFRSRPPAYVCHVPLLNENACDIAKANWTNQFWRAEQPGGYFAAAWENGDSYCNIDNDPNVPCDQGLVPIYMAKVRNVTDVQNAVRFAWEHKLSTRVKGASHDVLGRSSGNGTFGISTVELKGITFEDDFKPRGAPPSEAGQSVVHVGSGEHLYYVNKAADDKGVVVVGGNSFSLGAAGGWILGGGHSALSPQYGLGADNVLEFEIVTPDGNLRTVNQYQEHDLFWALRGGGSGFGILTRVTYKTYPAIRQIVRVPLNITYTTASYRNFLRTWFGLQSALQENNFTFYSWPGPTGLMAQLFVHNFGDLARANATLQPLYTFAEQETAAGRPVHVQNDAILLPSYFSIFSTPLDQVYEGAGSTLVGGSRLVPLSAFEDLVDPLIDVFVNTTGIQIFLIAGGKVSEVAGDATSVHPSLRKATHYVGFTQGWETDTPFEVRDLIRRNMTEQTQALARLIPEFGSYHNEADGNEPRWSEAFWGSNYDRLLSIKNTVDPFGLFTCRHCVGDYIEPAES